VVRANSIFVGSFPGSEGTLTVVGGAVFADRLRLGTNNNTRGTLRVTGGTFTVLSGATNALLLGDAPGATGSVQVTGGNIIATNVPTRVGSLGYGQMTVSNGVVQTGQTDIGAGTNTFGSLAVAGGNVIIRSNLTVGLAPGSTGVVTVSAGTLVVTNAPLSIGNDGTVTSGSGIGRMVVSNGTLQAVTILLGSSAGGQGGMTLDNGGAISSVGINPMLVVNDFGQIGGDLSWTNIGSAMYCGYAHPGAYALSNGTSSCQDVYVGYDNAGTMTIAGGAMSIFSRLTVGHLGSPMSTGAVWITGGQLTMTNNYSIIGNSGIGQVTMSNGTVTAVAVIVGNGGNPGTLTVAGGTMTVLSNMTVGNCGGGMTGIVTITGGALYVTNAAHSAVLDVRSGKFLMSGGTVVADKIVMTNACGLFQRTGGTLLYSQLNLDPNLNADGDGIPNGWKQQYGLDPFDPSLGSEDPDGDGFNNLQEYLAGTDPTNAGSSPLRITAIARESNNIRVTWSTFAGTTNALQATRGAADGSYSTNGFANLFSVTNVVGSVTNYLDAGAATNFPSRFYRVRLVP
jgi:T5SS/PEP-CTERM-associated repeat protein